MLHYRADTGRLRKKRILYRQEECNLLALNNIRITCDFAFGFQIYPINFSIFSNGRVPSRIDRFPRPSRLLGGFDLAAARLLRFQRLAGFAKRILLVPRTQMRSRRFQYLRRFRMRHGCKRHGAPRVLVSRFSFDRHASSPTARSCGYYPAIDIPCQAAPSRRARALEFWDEP